MNTRTILIALAAIAIVGLFYFVTQDRSREQAVGPSGTVSNEIDAQIREQVSEFGKRLKNVSLLQSPSELSKSLDENYGTFVSPELLSEWKADPEQALGRNVSSPWPDRIEIVEIVKEDEGAYRVEGNIIEVANAERPLEPSGVLPVTLTITKSGDTWLIAGANKGAYGKIPQRVSIVGYWECLPHRNASGPQTLECAFGIAADQSGEHYAIDTRLMSAYPVDYLSGAKVRVEGVMTPIDQISADTWRKYDIEGIISATAITPLK